MLRLLDDPEPAVQQALAAAHRAVGSMEPSNVDGRRLIMLGAAALVFGFVLLISGPIEWMKRLRE